MRTLRRRLVASSASSECQSSSPRRGRSACRSFVGVALLLLSRRTGFRSLGPRPIIIAASAACWRALRSKTKRNGPEQQQQQQPR